jgi:glycosyltransferase involved in cell wall biosynthesis
MLDERTPLISVIVAVFNGEATLQNCLESVSNQTYAKKELIIIDGGSTDGTVGVIEAYQSAISYWVSEPDRGIYNAWNKGLACATGDWICFLGADDWLAHEEVLKQFVSAINEYGKAIQIAYGQVEMISMVGDPICEIGAPWGRIRKNFFEGTYCLPTPGVFHHHSVFAEYGLFDEAFRIAGDYELLMRVLSHSTPLYLPNIHVTYMQQGGISNRPSSAIVGLQEIKRALKKNGLSQINLSLNLAFIKIYMRTFMWGLFGKRVTDFLLDFARRVSGKKSYWSKIKKVD